MSPDQFRRAIKPSIMRSRITIDLDQDNQPIIKIDYLASEDVRDKMVKRFLESFGGSCEAVFRFENPIGIEYINSTAIIRPPAPPRPEEVG